MSIRSFGRKAVEEFFLTGKVPRREGWASAASIVRRKLDMIDYASILNDLTSPPGNRLEALRGNLKRFHSVRVDDQWRVVFKWTTDGPEAVDIVDYH